MLKALNLIWEEGSRPCNNLFRFIIFIMRNNSVSILCADVSRECLSRALTLAEILAKKRQVQIVGFARDNFEIWPPANSADIPIIKLEYGFTLNWHKAKNEINSIIDQSRLIICKPRLMSMGLALSAGCDPDECILDINDWELGLSLDSDSTDGQYKAIELLGNLFSPNSPLLSLYFESRIKLFPFKIVNNRWLQNRYGGELLYDVRDTDALNPENYDRRNIRKELGLDDRQWLIFAGTPRKYKGVGNLIYALERIRGFDAPGLLLCGGATTSSIDDVVNLANSVLGNARFKYIPQYDRRDTGKYLSASDIVCIPALLKSNSVGQVPTKFFEALAMGLPVITSDICDLPELVRDVGVAVPAGDIIALNEAIKILVSNPDLTSRMGKQARLRAVEQYSYRAAAPVIDSLLEKIGS